MGGLSLEVRMLLSSPAPSHLFYILFLLLFNMILVSVDGNFFSFCVDSSLSFMIVCDEN